MGEPLVRYRSMITDSELWAGFLLRPGDIVISTPPKCGTTWMQMICALLIFQTADLPAPMAKLSPWLDYLFDPAEEVRAGLSAQEHRRFIKTHTPLDGIPSDPETTYIVVGRHPLDVAVSFCHMLNNIDHGRVRQLTGQPEPDEAQARPSVHDWLLSWIDGDVTQTEEPNSLPSLMWHLSDAWARRNESNVVLVHYDDLSADLEGEMRRLARLLGVTVPDDTWPSLVKAATFEQMRSAADRLVPDPQGVLKDSGVFFLRGTSGAGRELLTSDELARYHARAAQLAPPDLLAWLNREDPQTAA